MGDALRFTVYFDGTRNNKDLSTPEGTQTNVARLFELDTAKGTNLARNSGAAPSSTMPRSAPADQKRFTSTELAAKPTSRPALPLRQAPG